MHRITSQFTKMRRADMRYHTHTHTHSKMPLCLLFFSPHKYRIESNNFLFSSLIMVYATELPDAIHRQNEVYIYIYIYTLHLFSLMLQCGRRCLQVRFSLSRNFSVLSPSSAARFLSLSLQWVMGCGLLLSSNENLNSLLVLLCRLIFCGSQS